MFRLLIWTRTPSRANVKAVPKIPTRKEPSLQARSRIAQLVPSLMTPYNGSSRRVAYATEIKRPPGGALRNRGSCTPMPPFGAGEASEPLVLTMPFSPTSFPGKQVNGSCCSSRALRNRKKIFRVKLLQRKPIRNQDSLVNAFVWFLNCLASRCNVKTWKHVKK